MKLTNRKASEMFGALKELAADRHSNHTLAFRVKLNITLLTPVIEAVGEREQELVEQYGIRDDAGRLVPTERGFRVSDPKAFTDAMKPVLDEEVEITGLKPITYSLLENDKVRAPDGSLVALTLSPDTLVNLGPLLSGEPAEPKENGTTPAPPREG